MRFAQRGAAAAGRARERPRPVIVGAACNVGIKPYDDGTPRALDQAPRVLRAEGLAQRLGAGDAGDLAPDPYRDFERVPNRPRNEAEVLRYSRLLGDRVGGVLSRGEFPVVLGGDCSIVLGCLLGARRAGCSAGLVYLDGHADFATPAESRSGSVASMCLALAVGRGDTPLARLDGGGPLAAADGVALIGRRDQAQPWYGHDALRRSAVLDLPHDAVAAAGGYGAVAERVLERVAGAGRDGFWIHLDADVLSPAEMPAVDSPEPGGPGADELAPLLGALVRHPFALGLEVTIYDPRLDPERAGARRLVALIERAFEPADRAA